MRMQQELRVGMGLLFVMQLMTAAAALALTLRMSPAVERILSENVASLRAAEDMLSALALRDEGAVDRFEAALARARSNITVKGEPAVLDRVQAHYRRAFEGDLAAQRDTVTALRDLTDLNERSMQNANLVALRLGSGGAWVIVLLGLVSLLATAGVVSRLQRRIGAPLEDLHEVICAQDRGDHYRRARGEGPSELARIAQGVNRLLDQQRTRQDEPQLAAADRATLLWLLDREKAPLLVVDRRGTVLSASREGLALLDSPNGAAVESAALAAVRGEGITPPVQSADELQANELWLIRLSG